MRWLSTLLLLASLVQASDTARPKLEDEEYEIYRAFLYYPGHNFKPTWIQLETVTPHPDGPYTLFPDLERTTLKTFTDRNARGGVLEAERFDLPQPICLRANDPAQLPSGQHLACDPAYRGPRHRLSRVGVNHDRTQALLYSGNALYLFEKFKGRWKLVQIESIGQR